MNAVTTLERTPTQLTVLKLLIKGREPDFVSNVVGIPEGEITAFAEGHGYPDVEKMRWAVDLIDKGAAAAELEALPRGAFPRGADALRAVAVTPARPPVRATVTPIAPEPDEPGPGLNAVKALRVGMGSDVPRIRKLAEKANRLVDELVQALLDDEESRQARAEVERLEAELAAAKAKLKGAGTVTHTPKVSPAYVPAVVRAWARENGVPCNAIGRVPQGVVDAWREATAADEGDGAVKR